MTTNRAHRRLRFGLRLFVALLVAGLLLEGSFRFLLFNDSAMARRLGARLRQPEVFAPILSDDYWKLRYLFAPGATSEAGGYDSNLGWINSSLVTPETYEHKDFAPLDARRPVLLYGDSFALCYTTEDDCWQGLLERSDLRDSFQLLNYGASGFGLDQTYLQYLHSIDLYADRNPLVVISIYVEDDMDRCMLRMRGQPKPRFALAGGRLELESERVIRGRDEYIERYPVSIASYVWRYLLFETSLLPARWRQQVMRRAGTANQKRMLVTRILDALQADLDGRGYDYFFLLFHGRRYLTPRGVNDWRESFLIDELQRRDVPFVSSLSPLLADLRASGRSTPAYFIGAQRGRNHYTELGNEVVFGALNRALLGDFRPDLRAGLGARPSESATYATGQAPPFGLAEDATRLEFRPAAGRKATLSWTPSPGVKSFRALLKADPHPGAASVPSFVAYVDGTEVAHHDLQPGSAPIPIDIALAGAQSFVLSAEATDDTRDAAAAGMFYLASPSFE